MKFKNRYKIDSARLPSWDYSSPGWYFVTVCTKNKENFFGDVIDAECVYPKLEELSLKSG